MLVLFAALCLIVPSLTQEPAADAPEGTEPTVPLVTIQVPLVAGGQLEVDRGICEAPVVRDRENSGTLQVEFHRFHGAEGTEHRPPIFLLKGGPGFPGLRRALSSPGFYEAQIEFLAEAADVVVVGQRGIGSSTPNTACGAYDSLPANVAISDDAERAAVVAGVRACRKRWEDEGIDLGGFTVLEAADDVIDVADALGYDKVTLMGTSFGSHWGMAILRRHPDRVARALFGGIEGPDHTYDMPSFVLNALERIAAAAEKSDALARDLPESGLLNGFRTAIARLEEEPQILDLDGSKVYVDAADLRGLATGITARTSSRKGIRTWPMDMIAIAKGDLENAGRAVLREHFFTVLPTASFFGLDCGSGISAKRRAELLADPAAAVVGPLGQFYDWACAAIDNDLGDDFRTTFATDVPTLLVQGTWDTSTPLENAVEMAPSFSRSKLTLVEGGSHGALYEALESSAEFKAAVLAFLKTGSLDAIPTLVELPPLDWAAPPADEQD